MNDRRVFWLFLLLLAGQLVLVTLQAPAPVEGRSVLEASVLRVVAPIAFLVDRATGAVRDLGERLVTRRHLLATVRELRERVEELERQAAQTQTLEAELRRLEVAVPPQSSSMTVAPAEVIYAQHGSWLRTIVVRLGAGRPEVNQPVVTPAGLVGRVVVASGPYAKVQLVTDRAAAVGALVERTRRQGIVRGTAEGSLTLDYVSRHADVRVGDRLVTAGIDGVYPRGIAIGVVTEVGEPGRLFHAIRLAPAVDFGRLERVYLLPATRIPAELEGGAAG